MRDGTIENQVDLFKLKTKKEEELNEPKEIALNETVYKSFTSEESILAEKPVDAETKRDSQIQDKVVEVEVAEALDKNLVDIPSKPEVELIDIEKSSASKKNVDDLKLVIDDDEEVNVVGKHANDELVVVIKEAVNNNEGMMGEKETNKEDEAAKEVVEKPDEFDLLILTDEPEQIEDLKEASGKSDLTKRSRRSRSRNEAGGVAVKKKLETHERKARGEADKLEKGNENPSRRKTNNEKLEMGVRVDVARIRTRSASAKTNANLQVQSKVLKRRVIKIYVIIFSTVQQRT